MTCVNCEHPTCTETRSPKERCWKYLEAGTPTRGYYTSVLENVSPQLFKKLYPNGVDSLRVFDYDSAPPYFPSDTSQLQLPGTGSSNS